MKLVKNKLTTEEWSIYTYLRSECLGEKNAVHMNELAKITNMKERQVRQAISNITRYKPGYTIIAANHNGYFIPTEQERVKANAMLKSRVRGAIERMIANDPAQVNWLYTHIAEIKKQYDAPPQDQIKLEINGKTKDVNYTADKYMKQSLFD
jgi:hypothetical protein